MAEAASASIRATTMKFNEDGIGNRAAIMKVNEDRIVARAADAQVFTGNSRHESPRRKENPPPTAGMSDPSHPFYGVWGHWDPSHKPSKKKHRSSTNGRRMNSVSYTHLTLPTKRIV